MDWITAIKSFIAVIEANSFSKAADKRFTSPASMSRQINWLEEQLHVKLLARTTRTLQLTEEGKFFYQKGRQLIANLQEVTQTLQQQQKLLSGPLKITLPIAFGNVEPILQLLSQFSEQYPNIEINLDFSNQNRDLISDEIDVAFRAKPYEGNNYTSIKVMTLCLGLFAAPTYLEKKGIPQTIEALTDHNCLGHHYIGSMEWEFKKQKKISVSGNIQSNASQPLIELAKLGLGVIRTFEIYVQNDIKNKYLIPLLKKEWPDPVDIYLLVRSDLNAPLRIKAFADFVMKGSPRIKSGFMP